MRMNEMSVSCVVCRYACHRKCCQKMTTKCSKKVRNFSAKCIHVIHGAVIKVCMFLSFHVQYDPELSSRQFGVELSRLTNDERTVPLVAEKLINYIEMHGLYTEGIYRKSGSTNKIKELKQGLDTGMTHGLCFTPGVFELRHSEAKVSLFS